MQLIFLFLFCLHIDTSISKTDHENGKENKVIKNKGRLSRVTWQLFENENDNLDRRMFEDEDRSSDWPNNKIHYTKRKYNVKVEHKRKDKGVQTTTKRGVTIARRKEKAVAKYHQNQERRSKPIEPKKIPHKLKKNDLGKKISIGITDIKRTFKSVPNIKERNKFYNRNSLETDTFHKDLKDTKGKIKKKLAKKPSKKVQSEQVGFRKRLEIDDDKETMEQEKLHEVPIEMVGYVKHQEVIEEEQGKPREKPKLLHSKVTSASQVQMKPKTVYVKSLAHDRNMIRREPKVQRLTKAIGKNIQRKIIEDNTSKPLLPLMGLNANSLANPPKQIDEKNVHENDNTSIADELAKKVRILCWVMTHPRNHNRTCKPIKDTWGKRCNKLIFISTEYDPDIPTVKLDVQEGRSFLWPKVKAAFQYVYDNYRNEYDWYLRADDDSFMVIENLRYLLADFDPKEPMYFGCRFKKFSPQGFMSGGAGIPISNAALAKLVPAIRDTDICKVNIDWDLENDDVNLGVCLSRVGVKAMDSRDVAHKGRFLVFMPQDHVSPNKITKDKSFWYWKYVYYPTETGAGCCSDYAISFHYVSPDDMYALEYLIYRIRPYGIQFGEGPLPNILKKTTSLRKSNNNSYIHPTKEESGELFPYTFPDTNSIIDVESTTTRNEATTRNEFEIVKPTRVHKNRENGKPTTVGLFSAVRNEIEDNTIDNVTGTDAKTDRQDTTTPPKVTTERVSTTEDFVELSTLGESTKDGETNFDIGGKHKKRRRTSSHIRRSLKDHNDIE